MKVFVLCLAIAGAYGQQWPQQPMQWEQPSQWQQPMQWEQPSQWQQPEQYQAWPQQQPQQWQPEPQPQQYQQPQQQQQPQMSPDGYRIVPGVVDSRCPRTDDAMKPVHLPIQGNCRKFMKCYGGRAYEQDCPPGLEFGIAVNRCDYPTVAKCSSYGGGW